MNGRRALLLLFLVYFATRLFGLTLLPMFLDESWHLSWSMWIAEGLEWEVPWQYGKGLSIFATALLFPAAAHDYLAAGRDVLAITHKGVIRALYAQASGWPMLGRMPTRLDLAALQLFALSDDGALSLERLNLTIRPSQ